MATIYVRDARAMMAAHGVPVVKGEGPMLLGIPVVESGAIPPGVYAVDDAGILSFAEYEEGALERAGWRAAAKARET